jgi:hypothetical protein
MVAVDESFDRQIFDKTLKKYGGKIEPRASISYPSSDSTEEAMVIAQDPPQSPS